MIRDKDRKRPNISKDTHLVDRADYSIDLSIAPAFSDKILICLALCDPPFLL